MLKFDEGVYIIHFSPFRFFKFSSKPNSSGCWESIAFAKLTPKVKEEVKIVEKIVEVPVEVEKIVEKVLEVEKPLEVYGEKSPIQEEIEKLEQKKGKLSGWGGKKVQKQIDKLKSKLDDSNQINYF